MYKKGGPLNLLTWLKGGYLENMGAISGGLEKFGIKKQFLLHPPSNLNYDWSLSFGFHNSLVNSFCRFKLKNSTIDENKFPLLA